MLYQLAVTHDYTAGMLEHPCWPTSLEGRDPGLIPVFLQAVQEPNGGSGLSISMSTQSVIQSRFDTYLCRAAEARKIAASMRNSEHRQMWEEIADDWQRMAEQIVGEPRDLTH
jgi:hypothetical protein